MASLLDPVLVEEDVDDELELPSGPLEDDAAVEPSDSAGTEVTPGWVTPPKLDAPAPPPQAERALVSTRASTVRMGVPSLTKTSDDVTLVRGPLGACLRTALVPDARRWGQSWVTRADVYPATCAALVEDEAVTSPVLASEHEIVTVAHF